MKSYKKFVESLEYSNIDIDIVDYHELKKKTIPIDLKTIHKLLSDIKPILNKIIITYKESENTGNGADFFNDPQKMIDANREIFTIDIRSKPASIGNISDYSYTNMSISKIPDDWYIIGYYHRLNKATINESEKLAYLKIDSYGGLVKFLLEEAKFPS